MPVGFVNPKEKDLTGAERGIASYFKHPMRKTFQRAGKVLTWLLRQLPKSVPHFTLHKLHNLKTRVHKAANNLTTRYKDNTGIKIFCSDVKQMFTFLTHDGIRRALIWLFAQMRELKQYTVRGGINRTPRKRRKNIVTLVVETGEIYWGQGNHESHLRNIATGSPEDVITFTFDDLMSVVNTDLEYTYSTVGTTILKQKLGCPIGGNLSSFYANLYCAKQEYEFITRPTLNRKDRIHGIRQIDDVILWVAYDTTSKASEIEAEKLLLEVHPNPNQTKTSNSTVYADGLTVKREPIKIYTKNAQRYFQTDFAGMRITGKLKPNQSTDFTCETLNKNWKHLKSTGKQKVAKYPPNISYIHDRIKNGVMIGSMIRMKTQNSTQNLLHKHIARNLYEMKAIGYKQDLLEQTLLKLKKKPGWQHTAKTMLKFVRTVLYA